MIYLLIVNYNSSDLIRRLIHSIPESQSLKYHIVIINNSNEDQSIQSLENEITKVIDSPVNLGFGGACNLGINFVTKQDPHSIIWLLNPDSYFPEITTHDYWQSLVDFLEENSTISLLGTAILDSAQKTLSIGGKFIRAQGFIQENSVNINFTKNIIDCDWLSGCSLIINLQKFEQPPLFDEQFFLYYEDFDFCIRYQQAGHRIAATSQFMIIHQTSSIADRNSYHKMYYSTYSYLLAIYKHTSLLVFYISFFKSFIRSGILLLTDFKLGLSKIKGISKLVKDVFFKFPNNSSSPVTHLRE